MSEPANELGEVPMTVLESNTDVRNQPGDNGAVEPTEGEAENGPPQPEPDPAEVEEDEEAEAESDEPATEEVEEPEKTDEEDHEPDQEPEEDPLAELAATEADVDDEHAADDEPVELDLSGKPNTDTYIIRRSLKPPTTKSVFLSGASSNGHLPPEMLSELSEVLARLEPRDASEVLENDAVKVAVSKILDIGSLGDYRSKIVIPLRYGAYPHFFAGQPLSLNRGGNYIRFSEIMAHVPSYQGLSVKSTSEVTGLEPLAVLETERAFLRKFAKEKYPELRVLVPKVEAAVLALSRASQE